MWRVIMLGLLMWTVAEALGVKVTEVKDRSEVTVLLPAHNTILKGVVEDDQIRVLVGEWYNAKIEPDEGPAPKANMLVIKVPGQKPQRMKVLKVLFKE